MKKKTISIHYMEDVKTKKWMDKHVGRSKQSEFIREATQRSRELKEKK